jgi:hypothetical protein
MVPGRQLFSGAGALALALPDVQLLLSWHNDAAKCGWPVSDWLYWLYQHRGHELSVGFMHEYAGNPMVSAVHMVDPLPLPPPPPTVASMEPMGMMGLEMHPPVMAHPLFRKCGFVFPGPL